MNFSKYFLGILLLSISIFSAQAQINPDDHKNDHAHSKLHNDSHRFHIGFGGAGTYIFGADVLAPGIHVHFIRQMGKHHQWGIGLGYEGIVDEKVHNGLNLLLNYRPVSFLTINTGPGLVIGKHDGEMEVSPAFHTEAVFEFNLAGFHVGPMIGYGIDNEHSHVSVGVHFGIGF